MFTLKANRLRVDTDQLYDFFLDYDATIDYEFNKDNRDQYNPTIYEMVIHNDTVMSEEVCNEITEKLKAFSPDISVEWLGSDNKSESPTFIVSSYFEFIDE